MGDKDGPVLSFATKYYSSASYCVMQMLKQFFLQSCEVAAASWLEIMGTSIWGPCYCNNSIASALFQVSLLFAYMRLCQDQVTCPQPKTLGRTIGM